MCKCNKEKEIATLQADVKTSFKRIDELRGSINDMSKVYDMIYGLTTNISVIAEQMKRTNDEIERTNNDVKIIKKDIEEIKKKPAEALEHYKKLIVGGVLAALVGFMMGKIF